MLNFHEKSLKYSKKQDEIMQLQTNMKFVTHWILSKII